MMHPVQNMKKNMPWQMEARWLVEQMATVLVVAWTFGVTDDVPNGLRLLFLSSISKEPVCLFVDCCSLVSTTHP
jgi:hypothetical protein